MFGKRFGERQMSDLETILSESDVGNLHTEITDGYVNHGPYYAEFHITDKCNSSCYFCNQRKFRLEGQELELSRVCNPYLGGYLDLEGK